MPAGKQWLEVQDSPTSTMSPSEFVRFLRDSCEVENEGTEDIRGEETVHFSGPVDLEALVKESGESELLERLRQTPGVEDMQMLIDIWVGPDGLPARMILEADPPPASKLAIP